MNTEMSRAAAYHPPSARTETPSRPTAIAIRIAAYATLTTASLAALAFAFLATPLSAQPSTGVELGVDADRFAPTEGVFVAREGVQDPRFFGTYCNSQTERLCEEVSVKLLGLGIGTKTVCADVDEIRVALDHHVTAEKTSRGLLRGVGSILAEGNRIGICYSGQVRATGRASVSGSVPGVGSRAAELELSADGRDLTILSEGREFRLGKEACGNSEPDVTLLSPTDGTVLNRACPVRFEASYSDDRDGTIPAGRARFQSHRDGVLQGEVTESPGFFALETSDLSLGQHAITFLATDSGGLENGRTVTVEVRNLPVALCVNPDEGASTGTLSIGGSS